ncbi:ABC transporter substrate-binding protein [Donghicola eburneus]|jgi:iron complex transport system substrate-binding protein|uniref:ABC transporter substrate-binding protein n=1 Tax=Donghicola eburneus TaxID=393278 RepID=UPI0008DF1657|nr:ABC transporter substrate-binding protein [Donghicola eburneus]MCI5041586.1 ABC transporter substrate-binding protein [Donghicola eburneus]SFQ41845.1 iron complex transport system substrate-binding protein [Donghicola eburneus]
MKLLKFLIPLAAMAGVAHADPVTIQGCNGDVIFDKTPSRAITLNQQATEVMLALGLEGAMVGTAYLDDKIPAQWQDAFNSVPVLADKYPAAEVVMANEPDFLFAGFGSAFSEDNLGEAQKWHDLGIGTYLVDASCKAKHPKNVPLTIDPILKDIATIGAIFDVKDRASALIADTEARIEAVKEDPAGAGRTAFIYDSGTDTPYSIGCCGGPALVAKTAGLKSISADVEGTWVDLAWERVVAADPEIIVLIEADWSTAQEKREYMENDPVLSQLTAVKEGRFVIVPFSETLLGMRFADGVESVNSQLAAMK